MTKKILLTIDDSPSKHTRNKIDFLYDNNIPAIFFCRGEFITNHKDSLIYAIKKGFLLGNHSYTHPYFSKISLKQCFDEILRTESLIDQCYKEANMTRLIKIIRFPFGDKGNNHNEQTSKTKSDLNHFQKIQNFLLTENFQNLNITASFNKKHIDTPWTWDTYDYKQKLINDNSLYKAKLLNYWDQSTNDIEIILLHDFNNNHHLFEETMTFLLKKHVKFLSFDFDAIN